MRSDVLQLVELVLHLVEFVLLHCGGTGNGACSDSIVELTTCSHSVFGLNLCEKVADFAAMVKDKTSDMEWAMSMSDDIVSHNKFKAGSLKYAN